MVQLLKDQEKEVLLYESIEKSSRLFGPWNSCLEGQPDKSYYSIEQEMRCQPHQRSDLRLDLLLDLSYHQLESSTKQSTDEQMCRSLVQDETELLILTSWLQKQKPRGRQGFKA